MKEPIRGLKFRQLPTVSLLVVGFLLNACGVPPTPVPTESPGQIVANLVEINLSIAGRREQFLKNCWMSLRSNVMLQKYPGGPKEKVIPPDYNLVGLNPGYIEFAGNGYLFFRYVGEGEGDLYFVPINSADLRTATLSDEPAGCSKPVVAIITIPPHCEGPTCLWGKFPGGPAGPVGLAHIEKKPPNE